MRARAVMKGIKDMIVVFAIIVFCGSAVFGPVLLITGYRHVEPRRDLWILDCAKYRHVSRCEADANKLFPNPERHD